MKIEYKGEMLTFNAIAKKEGLNLSSLKSAYERTGDIYKAIELAKERQATFRGNIEYNGELVSLSDISAQINVSLSSLQRAYREMKDIYKAIELSKKRQSARKGMIEYNGETLSINAIAKKEGVSINSLKRVYKETPNIYDAVRKTKENQASRRGNIEYNGERLTIAAIARKEGLTDTSLKQTYDKTKNIYKAVIICKSRQIKHSRSKKAETKFGQISYYDLSIILGIKYSELKGLLSRGLTIEEIQEMELKTRKRPEPKKAQTKLVNGQTLKEYCIQNSLNYTCIYRLINTYGKTVEEATQYYKRNGQKIPETWIYEKYGALLKHIMLNDNIDIELVVKYMREKLCSLDEAIERYIIRRNARNSKLDEDWMEELYGVLTDANIGDEYDEWIEKFYVDDNEETCIMNSHDEVERISRKLDLFEIGEVLIDETFTPEEEKELLKQYNVTKEEIETMFIDLYGRFNSGILMGQQQEEEQRSILLNNITRNWPNLNEEQRNKVLEDNEITNEEQKFIETTSNMIEGFKELIKEESENKDEEITQIMRNTVRENVQTNKEVREEFRKIIEQSQISR